MLKRWLDAADDIRREKFGDTEDLRREVPPAHHFPKNKLWFFLAVAAAVILLQLFLSGHRR